MNDRYNPQETEKQIQAFWQNNAVYAQEKNPGPLYSIDTPPPTVSGNLHIGHIFSYTQTDIIARYKRMAGFSVFYPFGFDDNGLATERYVEKKCNVSAFQIGRTAFIDLCLKETAQTEQSFEELLKKMGLSIDWKYCYSTINKEARLVSQKSFLQLFKKGFIYRKDEPALYCPACRTTVAQAELEDVEKPSIFNEIIFEGENNEPLIIATTRPELLPSCVAIFYNPADTRYTHLQGTFATVPLFGFKVSVMPDGHVLADKGTGLVMCCTFGDKTDIMWFKLHKLPYRPSIGRDGKMTVNAGFLAGKKIKEARELVIEELKKSNLLKNQKPIVHAVNVHERCKNEIEYLALPQWFLEILPYKKTFIEQADKIDWAPEFMKSRYINWVENISWDWCLSRQRFYGIPFPAWLCDDCGEVILASENELPIDPQETKPPVDSCSKCGSANIVPDRDVMDTWNTSSLTPYICRDMYDKNYDQFLPMSMRPQAHDIIRTWAFYTIVKAWMHDNVVPWKSIVISGHVLTGQGDKISKSQANSPLIPDNLLKMYPADAIRYWTASTTLGHDIAFSETQLKQGNRLITKLWNACAFIKLHTAQYAHEPLTKDNVNGIANQWILHQLTTVMSRYTKAFESSQFNTALEIVERFFWHDVCDNYLEIVKDMLFKPENYNAVEVKATRQTLDHIGIVLLQLFAPFVPYITEHIYQHMYKDDFGVDSLHQLRFDKTALQFDFVQSIKTMDVILIIVAQIRKLKSEAHISLGAEVTTLTITTKADHLTHIKQVIQNNQQLLTGVTKAATIEVKESQPDMVSGITKTDLSTDALIVL